MMRSTRNVLACLCLLLALPTQANTLPPEVHQVLPSAQLNGQGSYRWFGLKLYDASLWSETKPNNNGQWWQTPLVLELVYARDLSGERIAQASIDKIRKLNRGTPERQAAWLQWMRETFPDVNEGMRLSGYYIPEQGVRFYRDGRFMKEISDVEFAQAFFAIWLDERCSAGDLRRALLGQTR
jgi:hypothetical protein